MTRSSRKIVAGIVIASVAILAAWTAFNRRGNGLIDSLPEVGEALDSHRGVSIYEQGPVVTTSHGKHYAADGYYYGQKWQCVEYIKRFYHDALNHKMPSVWGHARDFYDPEVAHGSLNEQRGLLQFQNGGSEKPRVDDLVVFRNGSLGHVAIISAVGEDAVEVIQQNVRGHPRSRHPMSVVSGRYTVGASNKPAGWLRLPTGQ